MVAKSRRPQVLVRRRAVHRPAPYGSMLSDMVELLELARRASARAVNAIMTATYWEIGRRIVNVEQHGKSRANYGEQLVRRLATDLTARFGRGFAQRNLERFRQFYLAYPQTAVIASSALTQSRTTRTAKRNPIASTALTQSSDSPLAHLKQIAVCFPLPWSHYLSLLGVKSETGRRFYEAEALRGGWTVRQLQRQVDSQFYERTALSRNKRAMLQKGEVAQPNDLLTPNEEIRDPLLLEFLDLKDEYSESDLEEALIHHLETFLLELGGDFAFVGRQRRLRIGDEWFRVDLVFFHRALRCLVIVDLKLGKFAHADAGQMQVYLNYAREHWTRAGENPPVGLILCTTKNDALAQYALGDLTDRVLIREYQTTLPNEQLLADEIERTRYWLESQRLNGRAKEPKS
jgi:predicted nuclease of restriction endonuclease-like (RecB) superfamily